MRNLDEGGILLGNFFVLAEHPDAHFDCGRLFPFVVRIQCESNLHQRRPPDAVHLPAILLSRMKGVLGFVFQEHKDGG